MITAGALFAALFISLVCFVTPLVHLRQTLNARDVCEGVVLTSHCNRPGKLLPLGLVETFVYWDTVLLAPKIAGTVPFGHRK